MTTKTPRAKRTENVRMQEYLMKNGIEATPMFIWKGSMKGTWRIYNMKVNWYDNTALQTKFNELGFTDFDGDILDAFSGSGGIFHIFARYSKTINILNGETI